MAEVGDIVRAGTLVRGFALGQEPTGTLSREDFPNAALQPTAGVADLTLAFANEAFMRPDMQVQLANNGFNA